MLPDYLFLAIAVFLLAGLIKGTVGIGLPTATIGILGQFIEPRLAISLTILPILATNVWQVWSSGTIISTVRNYWLLAVTMIVFMLLMSQFVTALSTETVTVLIGIMIIIFAVTNLMGVAPEIPKKFDLAAQGITGTLAGVMGGLTGLWGPPIFVYFLARRVDKQEFVGSVGALLLVGGMPLSFGYWKAGLLVGETATASALLIIPALFGFAVGAQIRERLDAERFRTILLLVFLLMGLNLLRRAFF